MMKVRGIAVGVVVAGLAMTALLMSCAKATTKEATGDVAPLWGTGDNGGNVQLASAKGTTTAKRAHDPHAVAPIEGKDIVSEHSPYADGACDFCHKGSGKDPGPITKPVNQLCFDCHSEFEDMLAQRAVKHKPATEACTNCHNPHNSREKNLLVSEQVALCTGCHDDISKIVKTAPVQHGAMQNERKCANCHNPHASAVDKLLVQLPYDLCIQCHSKDTIKDHAGTPLTNFQTLLANNPVKHPPVADKDCSACHTPHGGPNFRLLVDTYPAKFYSDFDPSSYALCFTCHDTEKITDEQTNTATNFRDGMRNLHYVHVKKTERGRTCRACHEVHAAKQDFQLRDGVPYGNKGWLLKLNYKKTATGGSCDKTCHVYRSYNNGGRKSSE